MIELQIFAISCSPKEFEYPQKALNIFEYPIILIQSEQYRHNPNMSNEESSLLY